MSDIISSSHFTDLSLPSNLRWADAEFRIDLCNYKLLREMNGLPVPVLFHLNDEMPWESKQMCNNSVIHDTYGVAPVTLRNYYFDETNSRALFYPLGAGRLSYLKILKSNAFLAELPPVPSSQRNFICSFAGRKQYKDSSSDGAIERAELMAIIAAMQESGGPSCYSLFSDMDENNVAKHGLDFNTYFNVMRNSIFAPCPGGNNPETFRHYEVIYDKWSIRIAELRLLWAYTFIVHRHWK